MLNRLIRELLKMANGREVWKEKERRNDQRDETAKISLCPREILKIIKEWQERKISITKEGKHTRDDQEGQ